ncbi:MAG TPA: hypothetical protein VE868_04950 [Balneolaceae bacterium]|nr:hypothetical protein [Balneolaceae bacterium]
MKADKLIIELEQLIEKAGYTVRKERGRFQGNHCVVEGEKLVVLNKKRPVEQQIGLLARVLNKDHLRDMYIKPAVRNDLKDLWRRFEKFDDTETENSNK